VTGKPVVNDDSRGPGLPATRSAKMVRCMGPRIRSHLSEKQIAKLQEHIRAAGCDVASLCRTFGVETLDQLPVTKFNRAIERVDAYRARHARGGRPLSREERYCALERGANPIYRRMVRDLRAGMDAGEAYDLALAEELNKGRPWRLWLLKWVAWRFLEIHGPKLKARWERETQPARDRATIDALAERLKANNVRGYRGKAEELYAKIYGITVHALRKRRQRRKKV